MGDSFVVKQLKLLELYKKNKFLMFKIKAHKNKNYQQQINTKKTIKLFISIFFISLSSKVRKTKEINTTIL